MPRNDMPTLDHSKPTTFPVFKAGSYNLMGRTFERLTVTGFAGRNSHSLLIWECKCSCGNITLAYGRGLIKGTKRSCGCLNREATSKRSKTHGMTYSLTHTSWKSMRYRCKSKHPVMYAVYGSRGITVCDRWQSSFDNFLADMGVRPSKDHQIERIDNNGNYEPNNCRWATRNEQARNRRHQKLLTYNGETMCLSAWAERLGVCRDRLNNRVRLGWTDERIISTPIRPHRKRS